MTMTSPATTDPRSLPLVETGEFDKYMLRTRSEMQMVLRGLRDHVAQITVFFNEARDLLLTVLVEVADQHLILDVSADEPLNARALAANEHYCVALLDKVRIQFRLADFKRVIHQGRPAFLCDMPRELLRLQRREFYRLTTPSVRPVKCRVTLTASNGTRINHELNLLDISGGGVGIVAPPNDLPLTANQAIPECRIDLPEVGMIICPIRVCSVFEITLKNGTRVRRAGCEFVRLPGAMSTLIQRYIIKVERERKARGSA